jgi:hypothetical protein
MTCPDSNGLIGVLSSRIRSICAFGQESRGFRRQSRGFRLQAEGQRDDRQLVGTRFTADLASTHLPSILTTSVPVRASPCCQQNRRTVTAL